MDNCIIKLDDVHLWDKICSACLNSGRSEFHIPLYQYNRGFLKIPSKVSREDVDSRKITSFLKEFCQKHQIEHTIVEKKNNDGAYDYTCIVHMILPSTTVSNIENQQIYKNNERENIIRKKVINYYSPMENMTLSRELKPEILQDLRTVIGNKRLKVNLRNNAVTVRYVVAQNFIQVEPDYHSHYFSIYKYADYNGYALNAAEMSALALVLLDHTFGNLDKEYPTQMVQKCIRILNVGVEVTLKLSGFSA